MYITGPRNSLVSRGKTCLFSYALVYELVLPIHPPNVVDNRRLTKLFFSIITRTWRIFTFRNLRFQDTRSRAKNSGSFHSFSCELDVKVHKVSMSA